MKKKSIISILISFTMIFAMILSACSKEPDTLEKYISSNEEDKQQIEQVAQDAGLEVTITGNDVNYTYDLKNFEGMTDELAKSDVLKESLASALSANASSFTSLCGQLEEESKIEGIQIIVTYTYDGETLVTQKFNKEGTVE